MVFSCMPNNLSVLEKKMDERNSGNNYTELQIIIMGATDLVLCHVFLLSHWCPSSASYGEQGHPLPLWLLKPVCLHGHRMLGLMFKSMKHIINIFT